MDNAAFIYPVITLALWTFIILLMIPYRRFKAAHLKQVKPDDFRLGESGRVPEWVQLANRNYMNLLELPVLFYVLCLLLTITGLGGSGLQGLAWLYVALRMTHSLIHVTYNNVLHRLIAFATSNVVLLAMWIGFITLV